MTDKLTEIILKKRNEQDKYFKNYLFWSKQIKKIAEGLIGNVRVFVFGSILRQSKNEIPRDIDILIISPVFRDRTKKSAIKVKIWQGIGIDSPFEIHLISPEDFDNWYRLFIKEKIEI